MLFAAACRTVSPASRLDALFSDLHRRGLFDGAVVVGDESRIVWEKGFGFANAEERVPFTPETPADGGSLAKTFTAALLLDLEREGMLDLDDPAQQLLPELPYPNVTLRHLITHRSGIAVLDYDYFDPYLPPPRIRTTEALLAVIAEQKPPLFFEPGTAFEYSSFAFDLAALAAARAARKSYGQLLEERYFRPLGITSAFLRPARLNEFPAVRTLGYRRAGGKLELNDVFDFEGFHGGSNIYLSARDLHRWNASFFSGDVPDSRAPLNLGSWYHSGDAFWYSGHLQGFHSEVFRNMSRRWSVVYVSNNTIEPWLQKRIVHAVTEILAGRDAGLLTPPALDEVRREDRASRAGTWRLPDGDTITIEASGTRLLMAHDGLRYRMVQVDPRTFYVPGLDFMVGFAGSRLWLSSNVGERFGV